MINIIRWLPEDDSTMRTASFLNEKEFFKNWAVSPINQEEQEMKDAMRTGALYITEVPSGGTIYHRTLRELQAEYRSKL